MKMKNNPFSYSRIVAAIFMITAITCSVVWLSPAFAQDKKGNPDKATATPSTPIQKEPLKVNDQGENQLIQQLLNDHLIDEIKGFIVERKQNKLYINGQQQTDEIANKYLSPIKQEVIRVEVFSFMERLKRHPESGILELIAPITFSSPCVKYTPKKPGC